MVGLKERINKEIAKKMQGQTGTANPWAAPRLKAVVVNTGIGRLVVQSAKPEDVIKRVSSELAAITGQKPVSTKAKKSIASFKTRENMVVGLKVTLHGGRMYDFLERFVKIALPRTRDFRGLEESCVDLNGNLNVGLKDHTVFPEASADAAHTFGLEFTAVMDSPSREASLGFFKTLGVPFRK